MPVADEARLQELLVRTSRTFALAIPLLPDPTRLEVSIAYLLFRIADTFEDAGVWWNRARQIAALECFGELVDTGSPEEFQAAVAEWLVEPPTDHAGYRELLEETPAVVGAFRRLAPASHAVILEHTRRTAAGMAGVVDRRDADGQLVLRDVEDLRAYCYIVAGIVGEMLTELFVLGSEQVAQVADRLRPRAAAFGEALQLVNILKDSDGDLEEGRRFLPAATDRSEVFALARRDLREAAEYVAEIQRAGGPEGVVRFTALPVLLARASLERVEQAGPGGKLTRPEVFAIKRGLDRALAVGRPAVPLD
jgi:farnesyl-diphosphate farnesyltransferase